MLVTFDNEKDWLEARKDKITGTRASAVVGMNKYLSNVELYEEMIGIRERKDISDKPCVIKGKNAEPLIRSLWALDHPEFKVIDGGIGHYELFVHPKYPYIASSLDGRLVQTEDGKKGILEIKTSFIQASRSKESWKDGIPDNYLIQLYQELLCSEYDFVILVAELKYGDDYTARKSYILWKENCKDEMDWLLNEEIKFYENNVKKKIPPNRIIGW